CNAGRLNTSRVNLGCELQGALNRLIIDRGDRCAIGRLEVDADGAAAWSGEADRKDERRGAAVAFRGLDVIDADGPRRNVVDDCARALALAERAVSRVAQVDVERLVRFVDGSLNDRDGDGLGQFTWTEG